jgi:hypothetical protein
MFGVLVYFFCVVCSSSLIGEFRKNLMNDPEKSKVQAEEQTYPHTKRMN